VPIPKFVDRFSGGIFRKRKRTDYDQQILTDQRIVVDVDTNAPPPIVTFVALDSAITFQRAFRTFAIALQGGAYMLDST
jgi:hypothetical protein